MKRIKFVFVALLILCSCGDGRHSALPAEIRTTENTEADFGTIYEADGVVQTVLLVRNETADTLLPVAAHTSCRCTEASAESIKVAPGEDVRITVAYNPAYRSGIFMEEIQLAFLNTRKYMSLVIKGEIVPCEYPVSEDHPYDYGRGLHLSHEVLHYGRLRSGQSRDIYIRYIIDCSRTMFLVSVRDFIRECYVAALRVIVRPAKGRDTLHFRFTMPSGLEESDTLIFPLHISMNGKTLDKSLNVKAIARE